MENVKIINDLFYENIQYKIFNPGGNITALVDGTEFTVNQKKLINKRILESNLEVEQVGFLSKTKKRLEMAGGELCLNATRCAILEYLKGKEGVMEISVSGYNKKIIGKIYSNKMVEIEFNIEKELKNLVEIKEGFLCVKLNGIVIAILDEEKSKEYVLKLNKNEEKAKQCIKQIMKKMNFKEKAIGVILLENYNGQTKINPIVWVKSIDTLYYETACGSGSLGTAIYNFIKNNQNKNKFIQPSGYSIEVEIIGNENYISKAIIKGSVENIK